MIRALALALLAWGSLAGAQPPAASGTADAMSLLRRIYQATEKLSYSGTFVYQQGERSDRPAGSHRYSRPERGIGAVSLCWLFGIAAISRRSERHQANRQIRATTPPITA